MAIRWSLYVSIAAGVILDGEISTPSLCSTTCTPSFRSFRNRGVNAICFLPAGMLNIADAHFTVHKWGDYSQRRPGV